MQSNGAGWLVADVMREPVCIEPHDSVTRARLLMQFHGIGHLVVTDGRRLIGLASEGELRRLCRAEDPGESGAWLEDMSIGDVMIQRPTTLPPSAPLYEAAELLRGRALGCIPIVENDRVVGTVTEAELSGGFRDRSGDGVIPCVSPAGSPVRRARRVA